MPGKWVFIKLVALFISITVLGFYIGYSYVMETSKAYTGDRDKEIVNVKLDR